MTNFSIPTSNLSKLKARFEALNKKAKKLNCDQVSYKEVGTSIKKVEIGSEKVNIEYTAIEVSGFSPVIAGWHLDLVIDHTNPGGNVVIAINKDLDATAYRSVAATCQHCNKVRSRNFTYLLSNNEGDRMQVGKTCLKDFTGHQSPEDIASFASMLQTTFDEILDDESVFQERGSASRMLDLRSYLARVANVYDHDGRYYTKTQALDLSIASTSDAALSNKVIPTDANYAMADAAIAFCSKLDTTNEFQYNLVTLLKGEYFDFRYAGTVAYAIRIFAAEQERLRVSKTSPSNHVGVVGDRIKVEATLTRVAYVPNYDCYSHDFVDEHGNVFNWFTSRKIGEVGDAVSVMGTIKNHNEFKGVKQTALTRCKVLNEQ